MSKSMDPDTNLREQLEIAASLLHQLDHGKALREQDADDVERLCVLVQALDGWMRRGGFSPKRWGKR